MDMKVDGPAGPLAGLLFERRFATALPADPSSRNVPRQAPGVSYSPVAPTPVANPQLLGWADAVGDLLGIARPAADDRLSAEVLGGNCTQPGMFPYAARYGGHQFGQWAGQLGDGRAITLGEVRDVHGGVQELQLKGAGRTPYSRTADGRAVLRSSVREFLCSEAMHHLGVPTTRALSLVGTGEMVIRDMFYDGRPRAEPGAVVCRVAPSFIRFGNFQIHAAFDEHDILRQLADFVIDSHFPALATIADPVERYAAWFDEVCRRTALMVAHWMRVGFVHGVMNTDNMSILGLSIDYGPYGWLEGYQPGWTPNTPDAGGRRYCFGRQPQIRLGNPAPLADALLPLVPDQAMLEAGLERYAVTFEQASRRMMADKFGLPMLDDAIDGPLLDECFELLEATETDMTIFFRQLSQLPVGAAASPQARLEPLLPAFYAAEAEWPAGHRERLSDWLGRYAARLTALGESVDVRRQRMNLANPKYVLRNYLAQQAIDALESGDASVMERLMLVMQRPYDEQPEHEALAARRPEWARNKAGCSALSCSS